MDGCIKSAAELEQAIALHFPTTADDISKRINQALVPMTTKQMKPENTALSSEAKIPISKVEPLAFQADLSGMTIAVSEAYEQMPATFRHVIDKRH